MTMKLVFHQYLAKFLFEKHRVKFNVEYESVQKWEGVGFVNMNKIFFTGTTFNHTVNRRKCQSCIVISMVEMEGTITIKSHFQVSKNKMKNLIQS